MSAAPSAAIVSMSISSRCDVSTRPPSSGSPCSAASSACSSASRAASASPPPASASMPMRCVIHHELPPSVRSAALRSPSRDQRQIGVVVRSGRPVHARAREPEQAALPEDRHCRVVAFEHRSAVRRAHRPRRSRPRSNQAAGPKFGVYFNARQPASTASAASAGRLATATGFSADAKITSTDDDRVRTQHVVFSRFASHPMWRRRAEGPRCPAFRRDGWGTWIRTRVFASRARRDYRCTIPQDRPSM